MSASKSVGTELVRSPGSWPTGCWTHHTSPQAPDASRSPAASVLILLVAAASSQVGSWRPPRQEPAGQLWEAPAPWCL